MDDDLMSLRGGGSDSDPFGGFEDSGGEPFDGSADSDSDATFGGFGEPSDADFSTSIEASLGLDEEEDAVPDWLKELKRPDDLEPEPAAAAPSKPPKAEKQQKQKAAPKPRAAKKKSAGKQGGFMGLTPQQGAVLAMFLFLDVSVLGCAILSALGVVQLPGG